MRKRTPAALKLTRLTVAIAIILMPDARGLYAAEYDAIPAAPRAMSNTDSYTLYLTLVVNGQPDDQIVPVQARGEHYLVEAGALTRNHVRIGGQTGLIDVTQLPEVKTSYNSTQQQLVLTVPDNWLPLQNISGNNLLGFTPAQSSTGLLLNYDSYSLHSENGQSYTATWLEQRLFGTAGALSNTGTWRSWWSGKSDDAADGYLRYDTLWKYNDEANMIAWQAGDVINNSLTWSNSTRLGGLRVARNFSVRPDLVTYPLINWSGNAALPGSVDLFINGYKASSSSINAGPFTLTNVPYINGAGEATVVTTDALGRQVSTSVPFYVSNQLLREGLSDFDLTAGALRQNYGIRSADYGDAAASGIWRYGLNNSFTLSLHAEGRPGLQLGGIGGDVAVGRWGTLSSAVSQSRADDSGNQYVVGYSYYTSYFGLAMQHLQRSENYTDISTWKTATQLSRQADQATLSFAPLGAGGGTVGLGYFDIRASDNSRTRLANLSWSRSLWGSSSLYLALNKTLGEQGYNAQVQVIVPLESGASLSTGVQRSTSGDYSERINFNRSAPVSGGLGWNLAYANGNSDYYQADASWKFSQATLSGGVYGESNNNSQWADLSGSVIWMDNALFATNKVNDAFILVSTDGYPDVPVTFENQLTGKTDDRGHLLIPWVSAWYPSKVAIDPLDLPLDASLPQIESRVAVREGSGTLVKFPVTTVRSASLTLLDAQQQPLPVGTPVMETHSGQTTLVGYGGKVWLSGLAASNEIVVKLPQGSCRHDFKINASGKTSPLFATFVCPDNSSAEKQP
ncbi:fimbrial biogenesis outer membrane usher protein [Erwinia sp. S43]|uniref:fimbria/pilus outer membrane usher protein n=1 Tax=unclassified Erwinia TaxID=2622719 RepID=UPI00190C3EA1|nr:MULTISPECIES: fimbria/pilus outer membrane usher protein [unclassified Erwinia]MBK0035067.1 fimbrial biogenesis outer membrane usher protein [Erwinia sp. S43]MCW1875362.1 fimbria/pilus outer membrane usher protein [Erwinia sp. INIA01]